MLFRNIIFIYLNLKMQMNIKIKILNNSKVKKFNFDKLIYFLKKQITV